ncbi:NAD-dependent epimerase/dehydratase family protein [Methylocystis sp.]|uniref:NAD-dependent epimerase/dehydratase family protein n=1 Tax=Methylocystis sp. TaxID=1911079 RepID=UPI003DA61A13
MSSEPKSISSGTPPAAGGRQKILVTGTAGFIGFSLARRLLADGHVVCGVDGMTPYYDVALKQRRHALLRASNAFTAHEFMLEDAAATLRVAESFVPDIVVHLAAQAGVRYSLENPRAYIEANLIGTFNVMEAVRTSRPEHFLLASTSSVYGGNVDMPFGERDQSDHPLTLYAATKKATEAMAHSYAHVWNLPTTAFRFFTVYGPWGRPDMALFKFVDAILNDRPIEIYGNGEMSRDFTYIDDLVESIARLLPAVPVVGKRAPAGPDSLSSSAPFRIVNIGGGEPVGLMTYVATIERHLGREAKKIMLPMQTGDVPATFARADLLKSLTGFKPHTSVDEGVRRFVDWYREYHGL